MGRPGCDVHLNGLTAVNGHLPMNLVIGDFVRMANQLEKSLKANIVKNRLSSFEFLSASHAPPEDQAETRKCVIDFAERRFVFGQMRI